jgi:hypothetical protein
MEDSPADGGSHMEDSPARVVVACNHGLLDYSIKLLFGLLGDYWMLPHIQRCLKI